MSPEREPVTLVLDGVEVRAPDGAMLVDAAKGGDVEIPVFCYEPKLGPPVGACRMCLVEVEGIPKLQTACSTPVRDGMVVYTRTDRVIEAQNAMVEFLLVNHPLDCPVCDKGGECPLQDIAMGWGPGRSRMSDPKRHFRKPVALSPLVRIDRERCILCYRCVRFSQEVAEDEQLQLLQRGASSYVGTFDDRPYIAPFQGNIIDLCPVGALTSEAYRFRARPWENEGSGSVCTLCPSQCNVNFTVRDERIQRVLARDNPAVDDGWLCDKGRFGFQMISSEERITEPQVGGSRAGWDGALDAAAERLRGAGGRVAVVVGGSSSNEEGYLARRIVRSLGSPMISTTDGIEAGAVAGLATPGIAAATSDLDRAESILVIGTDPLHSMPILDLRIRKAVRRSNARLVVASERPTALDGGSTESARYAPGQAAAFMAALAAELGEDPAPQGPHAEDAARIAGELRPGSTVVVWGERLAGEAAATEALLRCAEALDASAEGAGLIGVPDGANGRGLREVGCAGSPLPDPEADEFDAILLLGADPLRDFSDGPAWRKALNGARVIAVSMFENESTKLADVVIPAEAYAEKEGTVTHPDGRLQRLRPAVPRPGQVRPVWQVLVELGERVGHETGLGSAAEVLEAIAADVPFLAGLTHEEIGAKGVRWPEREAAKTFPTPPPSAERRITMDRPTKSAARQAGGAEEGLRLGTYRDLWAGEVTERNAALRFLAPTQVIELAPADAERLGIAGGERVTVSSNGTSLSARVAIRARMRPGAAFLIEGTAEEGANLLGGAETVQLTPDGGGG